MARPSDRALSPSATAPVVAALSGNDPSRIEKMLAQAFKAGWNERNRNPGLKRQTRLSLDNAILSAIGGSRYAKQEYVPDTRTYHHSIWLRSEARDQLAKAIEAGTAETLAAPCAARKRGPKDSPKTSSNPTPHRGEA